MSSVHFVDALNGWAAGGDRLLHTTDGGQTWTVQNAGLDTSIYAVHGVSPAVAWISGYNGLVAQTVDGGETWATDNPAQTRPLRPVSSSTRRIAG